MNIICHLILAGILVNSALADESSGNSNKIEIFLYDRCRVYSTNAATYDDVKKHLEAFSPLLTYAASLLPDGKEQFCNDERPTLVELVKQLSKELGPCFPKDEKYLPNFIYESFKEFMAFVCAGRNIDNFFSTQGADCRNALKTNQEGQKVGECFSKFFGIFDDVVKQDDLCLDLKSAKKCFGEAIARSCPSFAAFESLNNRFFYAIRKPCNSAITFGLSSFVLIVAGLISTKLFS